MDQLCSLPWCRKPISSRRKGRRFPSDRPSQLAWLDALDAGSWFSIPPETLSTGLILCGSHFDSDGNVKRRYETCDTASASVKLEPHELEDDSDDGECEDGYLDDSRNRNNDDDNYDDQCNDDDPYFAEQRRPLSRSHKSRSQRPTRKGEIRVNIVSGEQRKKSGTGKKAKMEEEQDDISDILNIKEVPKTRPTTASRPGPSKVRKSPLNSFDSDKLVRMTHEAFKSGKKEKGESAKRMSMSLMEKMEIIRLSDRGLKQIQIARKLGLKKSTVSSVIMKREKIEENYHGGSLLCRRVRKGTFDDVNQILYAWYQKVTSQNLFVNTRVLMTMAENIAQELGRTDFKGSQGWLDRFKQRYNIRFGTSQPRTKKKFVSREDAEGKVVVSQIIEEECEEDERVVKAKEWLKHIWAECRIKNLKTNELYSEKDVFFLEEIGILYRITPKKAWQFRSGSEDLPEFSLTDERITVVMCSNAEGTEKRKLLVTGGDLTEVPANLPVDYSITTDSSNWVTKPMFLRWLKSWNGTLQTERRKVVVVLSGGPIHLIKQKLSNISLAHIPIHHLPVLQPGNFGITRNFRARYRRLLLERLVRTNNNMGSVSCCDALFLLNTAWNELPPTLIKKAFIKAGFFDGGGVTVSSSNVDDLEGVDCAHLLAKAVEMGIAVPQAKFSFLDYVAIDENLYAMECSVSGILGESDPAEEGEGETREIEMQEDDHDDDDHIEPEVNEIEYAPVSSNLTSKDAHTHLVNLRNWAMSRKSCPLQVHNALSTLESFILGHH